MRKRRKEITQQNEEEAGRVVEKRWKEIKMYCPVCISRRQEKERGKEGKIKGRKIRRKRMQNREKKEGQQNWEVAEESKKLN